jgi:hypothetical protein
MPNNEEHCLHSLKRYNVSGNDIHAWIDEPSRLYGTSHRKVRHGLEDLKIAIKIFGEKYGDDVVRNIYLDHIFLDSKETDNTTSKPEPQSPPITYTPSPTDAWTIIQPSESRNGTSKNANMSNTLLLLIKLGLVIMGFMGLLFIVVLFWEMVFG